MLSSMKRKDKTNQLLQSFKRFMTKSEILNVIEKLS